MLQGIQGESFSVSWLLTVMHRITMPSLEPLKACLGKGLGINE